MSLNSFQQAHVLKVVRKTSKFGTSKWKELGLHESKHLKGSHLMTSYYFPQIFLVCLEGTAFQVMTGDGGVRAGWRREVGRGEKKKSICDCQRVRQCSPSLPRHTFPCRGRGATLVNVFVQATRPPAPARAVHRCLLSPPRLFFKKLGLLLECSLCPCPVP